MVQLPIVSTFCELVAVYAEYVETLEDECKSLGGFASTHDCS
jgi:hypothetical protein